MPICSDTFSVPRMLKFCILNEFEWDYFPYLRMGQIIKKRNWTEEKSKATGAKISKARYKFLNGDPERVEKWRQKTSVAVKAARKVYWANISDEDREKHRKRASALFAEYKKKRSAKKVLKKRINTYSGVITEAQMEELSAA